MEKRCVTSMYYFVKEFMADKAKKETLIFDEEQKTFSETFGVPKKLFENIASRLQLFHQEELREIEIKVKEKYPTKESMIDEGFENFHDAVKKIMGFPLTHTAMLSRFLDSELFKGLGWQPKTANDFFVLGMIFAQHVEQKAEELSDIAEKISPLLEKIEALRKKARD